MSALAQPWLVGVLALTAWLTWPRSHAATSLLTAAPADVVAAPTERGRARHTDPVEGTLAIAGAMDLLALALSSGAPVIAALEAVAERSGPVVGGHLRHVAAALRWGVDDARAWSELPSVWRPAAQAMALAGLAGVPPGQLLRRAARDVREQERRRLEESAARLSVRIVIPLGLCFLPAFGLLTVVPVVAALASDLMGVGP